MTNMTKYDFFFLSSIFKKTAYQTAVLYVFMFFLKKVINMTKVNTKVRFAEREPENFAKLLKI